MSTIDYTQVFEDPGKVVKIANRIVGWRETDADAVLVQNQEAQNLFSDPTGHFPEEHAAAATIFGQAATALAANMDGARATLINSVTAQFSNLIRRIVNAATSIVPITATTFDAMMTGLGKNMDSEAPPERIQENAVVALAPTYAATRNQGDFDAPAWGGRVTVSPNAIHGQLGQNVSCVLRCNAASYGIQGLETWTLFVTMADGSVRRSSISFVTSKTGVPITDVFLDQNGDPVAQVGGVISTGLDIAVIPPDFSSNAITGGTDPNGAILTVDTQRKEVDKTPFTELNSTFVPVAGTRNGKIYLHLDRETVPDRIIMTFYADPFLSTQLSQQYTYTWGDGNGSHEFLVLEDALSLFDPLFGKDDKLVQISWNGANLELYAADQTVEIEVPLPFAVGDEAYFDETSDQGGVFQTFFVEELGRYLPADNSPTISDSLAV